MCGEGEGCGAAKEAGLDVRLSECVCVAKGG